MSTPVRLSKCNLSEREVAGVQRVMQAEFLGMGPEVRAFEQELAAYIGGGREVICVANGTAALHLALQGAGVGHGDEVLVPTITYLASFQAISATGARPVACDVRRSDLCLDVADARRRITSRTKAIMAVHYASGLGDIDGIYALASEFGLRVVEDAAHAFGCRRDCRLIGSFGDLVCFSFDGIKNITCGEGGALVTSDVAVAARVRDARLLAVQNDSEKRYAGQRSWEFDVQDQGWRYHMSDVFAAIGRVQLSRLDTEFAPKRVKVARLYSELLSGVEGVRLLGLDYGPVVPHIFPVLIENGCRDAVRAALIAAGYGVGIHYKPNHLLSFFADGESRPVAEELYGQLLTLPMHVDVLPEDQIALVQVLRAQLVRGACHDALFS